MTALLVYQLLFTISISTNVAIALVHVFAPQRFAEAVGLKWQEPMRGFARAWGATLLGLHAVYLPGLFDPLGEQWINWCSIAIKFSMPIVFWSNLRGFKMFGLWDLGWGVALLVAYVLAIG